MILIKQSVQSLTIQEVLPSTLEVSTVVTVPGPVGPQGSQGSQGIQGLTGPPGSTGSVGPQGLTGAVGGAGPDGPAGSQGIQGLTGPLGPQGPTGGAGPQGAQGAQGTQGLTGSTGPIGPIGGAGPTGSQGVQGVPGSTGSTGPVGPDGPQGSQGIQGVAGSVGADGADAVAAGPDGSLQYRPEAPATGLAGALWAAIRSNFLQLLMPSSDPPAPPADSIFLFARKIAGQLYPAYVGPSGLDTVLQPILGRNKVATWTSNGNATTAPLAYAIAAPSLTGTATTRSVSASATILLSQRRVGARTLATAGTSAGWRAKVTQFFRNASPGETTGGFTIITRFGESDTPADGRAFVGMTASGSVIGNVNPSTLLNIVGIGYDVGDTEWQLLHNDSSGLATRVALGPDFPCNITNQAYEFAVFAPPGSDDLTVQFTRLETGVVYVAQVTTDLPSSKRLLAHQIWCNNGLTAAIKGLDHVTSYFVSDI